VTLLTRLFTAITKWLTTTLGLTGHKGQAMSKFDEILNKGQGLSYWLLAASAVFYGGLWLLMILLTGGLDHEKTFL
jgi:hypothetical protein